MEHRIIKTEDGSSTIFVKSLDQSYHSTHGAITESQHIFIRDGLDYYKPKRKIKILEIGFGTGLNALLSLNYARKKKINIDYYTIEKYPITEEEYRLLNYADLIKGINQQDFIELHKIPWNKQIQIIDNFSIYKSPMDIKKLQLKKETFGVVFFDAFSPDKQPELWSEKVFKEIYHSLTTGGVLTTYSVKGDVKRAMKSVGFAIEKIPGPKGKREILRAIKK